MPSTEVREPPLIELASASEARPLVIEESGSLHWQGYLLYPRLDGLRQYFESNAQEWRAELEREQKSALRTFLTNACRQAPSIRLVLADFREEIVDLLFVVEGDLYAGETQALSIMPRVRRSFPSYLFDVLVLPASAHESIHKWGMEPEPIYQR